MSRLSPKPAFRAIGAIALCAAVGSCASTSAIEVNVAVATALKSTCVEVSVYSSSDTTATALASKKVARPAGQDLLKVAIFQNALPPTIWVAARPLWGVGCTDPVVPNGPPAVVTGTFPESGLGKLDVSLVAPTAAEDPDGDGFVGTPNGADCQPAVGTVSPAAQELCMQAADNNCNGLMGCNDPGCPAPACLVAPATKLTFITSPQSVPKGSCSGAVVIQAQDAVGSLAPVTAATTVSLASSSSSLTFYVGANCTGAPITQFTFSTSNSQYALSFRGSTLGAAAINASVTAGPSLSPASQTEAIGLPVATGLAFGTAPQSLIAGACSADVQLLAVDSLGTIGVTASGISVTVGSTAPPLMFYAGSGCSGSPTTTLSLAAGQSSVTYSFRGTVAATGTLTATGAPLTSATPQTVTISPAAATKLVFVSGPVTLIVNGCSPQQLRLVDTYGNAAPSAGFTITLTAPAGVLFHSAQNCSGGSITSISMAAGASTTAAFAFEVGCALGPMLFTASGGGFTDATQTNTVVVGPPTQLVFSLVPATFNLDECNNTYLTKIQSRDECNHPAPVAATRTFDLGDATKFSFYSTADANSCTNAITTVDIVAGTSEASYYSKGTNSGTRNLNADDGAGGFPTLSVAVDIQ